MTSIKVSDVSSPEPVRDDIISEHSVDVPVPVDEKDLDEPAYGWVCTICVFFINGHTWGLNSSYGVFLAYYLANNTFPGATRLDYAFVGGLSISQAMFVSPLATASVRYLGTRYTLLIGVFFETLSFIGASFAKSLWQILLAQGICFGWGMGFLFAASVGIVPQWFHRRRSLANGIGTAGSGLGGMVYSLAANAMIQRIGLAWAFRVLGIISFFVNFVCSILIKDRNKHISVSLHAFDVRFFKRPEFWLLLGYGFFSMLGYIVLLFSLPNYADYIGLTAKQGSIVGAVLNLGQGIGRPPIGYFSDSVGRINIATVMTLFSGLLSFIVWVNAKSFGVLVFYALIGGTVAGTFWPTVGPVTAEVTGLAALPAALSITWVNLVLPTTFSEPIALEIVQHTGRYLGAQLFTGFMYCTAAFCIWMLRAWKIGEMEKKQRTRDESLGPRNSFIKRLFMIQRV
ncbi:uncharacterized protein PV09_05532 [Verruconis gallopava]|uniref:Major facilitator superfamily (MFS) profile domain-containing protein n=1 Tax=Verruconis gallopava TaxID=253628 RepID=A0A0D1XLL3_9PEZI|nr:uncharacterized protein PV09_05532 [Verruconis gallopava]KIW03321.1 hypothetical protein PV09_05532 [Verruconis gallopava]